MGFFILAMMSDTFLLVGITDNSPKSQSAVLAHNLFRNGLDFLYWRNPPDLVHEALREVADLAPDDQARILLATNGSVIVPPPFRWHGKESDRQGLIANKSTLFSTSIHDLSEWPKLAGQVKLVFYSPVFDSISKPGYGPSVTLDAIGQQIRVIRETHTQLPGLIGLGGVNAQNIHLLQRAGFDGAALMGALWQAPDPIHALIQIRESVDS